MRKRLFTYLLFILCGSTLAQEYYILDTIESNGQKLILFSDNSYQYLDLVDSTQNLKTINELYQENILDTNKLFSYHWNNSVCHVKYKNLYHLQDTLSIFLGNKTFIPIKNKVTSEFGFRKGKMHKGIDVKLKTGDKIVSPFSGKVRYAKFNSGGYGNLVIIRHYNGLETYFAHLSSIDVSPNQIIKAGDIIGEGGNTGRSTGAHLHFELRYMGNAIDPGLVFNFTEGNLKLSTLKMFSSLFSYQKNGIIEEIDIHEIIHTVDPHKHQKEAIDSHNRGKRRKNPNGYNGNM